jgi:hypothetical protein
LPTTLVGTHASVRTDNLIGHVDILTRQRSCFYVGAMACCAALAIVLAGLRSAWALLTGGGPVEDGFPPPASWGVGRDAPATIRPEARARAGMTLGPILGTTVLGYGALVHVLAATGLARVEPSWLVRDAVLGVTMIALLAVRRAVPTTTALMLAGGLWFVLGAVDMHVLGRFEFDAVPLALDAAFHLSGAWLAVAAAAVAVAQRRPSALPMGSPA